MKYKKVGLGDSIPTAIVKGKKKKADPPTPLVNETQLSFFEGIRAVRWHMARFMVCDFQARSNVTHKRVGWMVASKFSGNDEIFHYCCFACKEMLLTTFAPFCNTGQEDAEQEGEEMHK